MIEKHKCIRALAFMVIVTTSFTVNAADLTAQVGWNSEYIFRGVSQSDSSPFVGVDVEQAGFYIGTWAADVGDGLEVDVFGGYGNEWADFHYAIGVTAYLYTDDFDDEYYELNLSGEYGTVSADIAIGRFQNFGEPTLDYQYYTLGVELSDFYASISAWADDFDGEVVEVGYDNTLSINDIELVDYNIALIRSIDVGNRALPNSADDTSLILSISKRFGAE